MSVHLITGYAGKEHITSDDQASFNMSVFGSGNYVFNKGSRLRINMKSNTAVNIYDGDLLIHGRHVRVTDINTIIFDECANGMRRADLIVAEYTKDAITGIEEVHFKVIKGEEKSTSPTYPDYDEANGIKLYGVIFNGFILDKIESLFELTMSNKDYMSNMQYALKMEEITLIHNQWRYQDSGFYTQSYQRSLDFTNFFDFNNPLFFIDPSYIGNTLMEFYFGYIKKLEVTKTETGLIYTFYATQPIPINVFICVKGVM